MIHLPYIQRPARLALTGLTGCAGILSLALLHARLAAAAPTAAGVAVAPTGAAQSGAPGTLITDTLRVTNTGAATDIFTLTVTGQAWPTMIYAPPGRVIIPNILVLIQLNPGEGRTVACA